MYKTRLIGKVTVSKSPIKSKIRRNVLFAGVVGLMFSVLLAFFVEYLKKAGIKDKNKETL